MATHGLPSPSPTATTAEDLPDAERLLLDALRRWAQPGPAGPLGEMVLALAPAGVEGVALLLDAACRALPGLCARPLLCPGLAQEEAALLLALGAAQRGQRGLALALMQALAPPLAAHRAYPALETAARALSAGGLRLAAGGQPSSPRLSR